MAEKKTKKVAIKNIEIIQESPTIFPTGIMYGVSKEKDSIVVNFSCRSVGKDTLYIDSSIALTINMAKDLEKKLQDIITNLEEKK